MSKTEKQSKTKKEKPAVVVPLSKEQTAALVEHARVETPPPALKKTNGTKAEDKAMQQAAALTAPPTTEKTPKSTEPSPKAPAVEAYSKAEMVAFISKFYANAGYPLAFSKRPEDSGL